MPDAVNSAADQPPSERGAGGGPHYIRFNMAQRLDEQPHLCNSRSATYKKATRTGPGAHVIILGGEGYSLMWPEGEEPKRYDWEIGTMIVPPNMWYHQHFNTGTTPSRYLAFKHEVVSIRNAQGVCAEGPDQPPHRRRPDRLCRRERRWSAQMFSDELAKHGLTLRMDQAYAAGAELADLPPLANAG